MVRRMRVGQLNAGLLSVTGLLEIDRTVSVLQNLPLVYRNWDELDYVRDRIAPMLEQRLFDKGFVVLFWETAAGCASSRISRRPGRRTSSACGCSSGLAVPSKSS
jgi:TRAP-type C4-dicarboxylate transport system substrate-binding protein